MDQSLWPWDGICLQTQPGYVPIPETQGGPGPALPQPPDPRGTFDSPQTKTVRTNARRTGTADGNHEQLPLFLWVEIFQTHRFPSCSFDLMGRGKQNRKAVSGQGRRGAQHCLFKESLSNSSSESRPFQLISTACPLGLSLLSPNR